LKDELIPKPFYSQSVKVSGIIGMIRNLDYSEYEIKRHNFEF